MNRQYLANLRQISWSLGLVIPMLVQCSGANSEAQLASSQATADFQISLVKYGTRQVGLKLVGDPSVQLVGVDQVVVAQDYERQVALSDVRGGMVSFIGQEPIRYVFKALRVRRIIDNKIFNCEALEALPAYNPTGLVGVSCPGLKSSNEANGDLVQIDPIKVKLCQDILGGQVGQATLGARLAGQNDGYQGGSADKGQQVLPQSNNSVPQNNNNSAASAETVCQIPGGASIAIEAIPAEAYKLACQKGGGQLSQSGCICDQKIAAAKQDFDRDPFGFQTKVAGVCNAEGGSGSGQSTSNGNDLTRACNAYQGFSKAEGCLCSGYLVRSLADLERVATRGSKKKSCQQAQPSEDEPTTPETGASQEPSSNGQSNSTKTNNNKPSTN